MRFSFWENYTYIPYDVAMQFDLRLQNVLNHIEAFFADVAIADYPQDKLEFLLAGSCIKSDTFRDIDIFIKNKDELNEICKNFDQKNFLYSNNASTYEFNNEIVQIVYRERFKELELNQIVDIFDFYSTKVAFHCVIDLKSFKTQVIESDIREEFVSYVQTKNNYLCHVNRNPFVSLQRAIHFLKRGDNVPYSVFLDICSELLQLDKSKDIETYFDRLQGDDDKIDELKEAITHFIKKNSTHL